MSFKKWHDTKFMPRVWLPKEAEGRKARDKKLLQLGISAHTSMLRHRPSRPQPLPTNIPIRRWRMDGEDPPDDEAEDVLAADGAGVSDHEGAEEVASINGEDAGRVGPIEVGETILALKHELADTELKTKDEHFECLVEYLSEDSQMKSAILEDIIDKGLHGQSRLVHFIEQMEASTSTVVLQKAVWLGIAREGIIEQPKAYAVRFSKAALDCGRTKADINQRFMETLLEPWDREPDLKPLIPTFKAKHCLEVQDDKVLHVHAMAETAFMYETMIAQVTVSKMERAGSLTARPLPRRERDTSKTTTRSPTMPRRRRQNWGYRLRRLRAARLTGRARRATSCRTRSPTILRPTAPSRRIRRRRRGRPRRVAKAQSTTPKVVPRAREAKERPTISFKRRREGLP